MSDPVVRAIDVFKTFEEGLITAVRGVNLAIERGEFVGIMGPSGSGKSTLLHLIGALDLPTTGEIWLDGIPTSEARSLDAVRAHKVGLIFQLHNLIPTLTALENVEVPMIGTGLGGRARRARAAELLEGVDMGHRLRQRITKLSGGERQRVAIARALANRPPIVLADEPTGDVDSKTGTMIMETLHRLRRAGGATLIVVTHNASVVVGADRVFDMLDGVLHLRRPSEVRARAESEE